MSLQQIRKHRGLTAKKLSEISGLKHRTIQHLESKSYNINSYNLAGLCKLAIALKCNILDLLTDEDLKTNLKTATKNKHVATGNT